MSAEAGEIGRKIALHRKAKRLTLEQLARRSGLSKGYLSKIENGHSLVDRRSTLLQIAQGLGRV
jgi:transcriptional regulator with XRE-family HTH domain